MADDVLLPPTGTGTANVTVATDDISGKHYQRIKLADGAADSTAMIGGDASNGLDVDLTRGPDNVRVSVTPTISAAGIYASGDAVGGLLDFGAVVASGRGGLIVGMVIVDMDQELAPLELVLFDRTFTNSSDNAPFDPTDSDLANCLGVIACGPYSSFNDNAVSTWRGAHPIHLNGTNLFGQLVVRSTPTYTATSDIQVKLIIQPT